MEEPQTCNLRRSISPITLTDGRMKMLSRDGTESLRTFCRQLRRPFGIGEEIRFLGLVAVVPYDELAIERRACNAQGRINRNRPLLSHE